MLGFGIKNVMAIQISKIQDQSRQLKKSKIMTDQTEQIEIIIQNMGEAIIATTNTVETLAEKLNDISDKIQQQENQIQQQGYQIFALTEAIQTLVDSQSQSQDQLTQLTDLLQTLVTTLNSPN